MPQVRVQDLEDGDIIVPSMRIVTDVTMTPDTPAGYRVIILDGNESLTLKAEKLVTVQRN